MKKIYQKPEVEIFEFEVENGFALSYDPSAGISGSTEKYQNGSDLSWDGAGAGTDEGGSIGANNNGLGNSITWDF